MNKIKTYLKAEFYEMVLLLKNIPCILMSLFTVSVVCMNLMANKTIINKSWVALDAGFLISWISFLCMDIITKHFGPKASTTISIIATCINLLTCIIFWICSIIPTEIDYTAFNKIFGSTWFILLSSTIAFLISSVINNSLNWLIGKMCAHRCSEKLSFYIQSYVSTFIGQFLDNLIFSTLVFMLFAPIYWEGFSWTFIQTIMCAFTGALFELIFEIIFSPIGYRICKGWKNKNIGIDYIQYRRVANENINNRDK